jgi:hypothetical protein
MTTICSCLKYFGQAIIGVSREQDTVLINDQLDKLILKNNVSIKRYIHVVQLVLGKPSYLPFHLLAWGQQFGDIFIFIFHDVVQNLFTQ